MSYTVTQLITRAYQLSGIVPIGLKTVSGEQLETGLYLLNNILAMKSADIGRIPYFTNYTFNAVAGQELYVIPNLLSIETFVFYLQTIRYPLRFENRDAYFGSARTEGILSLPYKYYLERQLGGSNLYIYFLPDQDYSMELWGKFALTSVTINQDLTATLDGFYIEYLHYALADEMCGSNNQSLSPRNAQKLASYEKRILHVSPPDLMQTKLSTLQKNQVLNYAQANLGHGWTAP